MEKKTKKKLIIVIVCVALVVTIAVSSVLYFVFKDSGKGSENENNTVVVNQTYSSAYEFTNCSNESILKRVISTSNYNGQYTLSSIVSVEFNEELTEEFLSTLYSNYGVRDANSFKQYLLERRKALNETFTITRYLDETGDALNYATFVATSDGYNISSGDVYGDDTLALVIFNDGYDKNFFLNNTEGSFYISLEYTPQATDDIITTEDSSGDTYIYLFENVYSSNTPSLRLFTITYSYVLSTNKTTISNADMVF